VRRAAEEEPAEERDDVGEVRLLVRVQLTRALFAGSSRVPSPQGKLGGEPCGRATIAVLQINLPQRVALRRQLMAEGAFRLE